MKLFKLSPIALATSLALVGLSAVPAAHAELGYSAAVSSMYLWRGQDVSDGPAVSGEIDYSHESGLYASTWVSSGLAGSVTNSGGAGASGYEVDVWGGYKGTFSGVGVDLSYWFIRYPQGASTLTENADSSVINEIALNLSYDAFSFGYVDGDTYSYMTLGYGYGPFKVKYGMSSPDTGDTDYSHLDLTFAATDALSFTLSTIVSEGDATTIQEDTQPLFLVTYSLPIGK